MSGTTLDDGRIRLGYKWQRQIQDDYYEGVSQYHLDLPAGTPVQTINRLRSIASGMANDYGMLAAEQDVIKAMEQSKAILQQAAIAAATAGAGSALAAARASKIALVANSARVGQFALASYETYEAGKGMIAGAKDFRQGNYMAGVAQMSLGVVQARGAIKDFAAVHPRLDLKNWSLATAGENGYLGANRFVKYNGPAQAPKHIPGYGWTDAEYRRMVKKVQAGETVAVDNMRLAAELRQDAFPNLVRTRYRGPLSEAPDLRGTYDWHDPSRMIHPGPHQTPHIQITTPDAAITRIEVSR